MEQKREHFRIIYPVEQGAKLLIKLNEYRVLDISQRGIKFAVEHNPELDWEPEMIVKGKITLLSGTSQLITGKVLRVVDDAVILYLDEPLELKHMYDEHRYVINHFHRRQP